MRSAEGLFLVDGPVLLNEVLGSSLQVRSVYVEESAERPSTERVSSLADEAGVRVRTVRSGVLAKLLDLGSPQGLVAVVEQPAHDLAAAVGLAAGAARPLLVLSDVADPGNVGTLVRSAEASGCAAVVVVGACADVFGPKTVRASAGAIFRVPVPRCDTLADLATITRASGVPLVATVGREGTAPEHVVLDGAVAIIIGSEAHGLAESELSLCDRMVSVPMEGAVESLNAAVAGSLVAFEAARQRRCGAVSVAGSQRDAVEPSGGAGTPLSHNGGPSNDDQAPSGERT